MRFSILVVALLSACAQGDAMGTETGGPPQGTASPQASASSAPRIIRLANADAAITQVRGMGRSIVTFLGFSGAGYEDPLAVERAITKVLDELNPRSVIISAGATPDGIGVVYRLAKRRGFTTIGIVSAIAEEEGVGFSPDVDTVFVVSDNTWGGAGADGKLSPTSAAIVGSADEMIAIGGGDIAKDEALAAKAMGKKVRYFAADMNHSAAIRKAREKRQPEPHDFRGTLHPYFDAK
jgi:hypothetical protein